MTYPSGGTPESAANYSSLATFAAKTEEDWTAELTDPVDAKATSIRDGLWADLPTGEGFGLTLLKELAKRILPLDAIADWTFIEDVLVAIDGWASDINAVVGEVLQDLVDFFSNLLDRSGFLSILEQVIEFFSGVGGELSGFLTVFEEIVVFFADILDRSGFFAVLQTVIEFFGTIADGTLDTFLAVFKAVVDFFLGITDFTLEQVFAVLGDLIDFFGELLDRSGFLAVFKDVTDFFSAAGGGALSTVLAALGDLVDWLITIVDRSGFLEVLRQVVDFFIGIADGVRDAFLDTVSNVVAFFDSLSLDDFTLEAFIEALGAAVNRLAMGVIPLDDIGRWVENTIVLPVVGALTGDGSRLDLGALGVWARNLLGRNDKIPADNLIGQISTALFGVIPLSSISDSQPNLLAAGNFDLSEAVYDPGAEFVWDGTQSHTGTGGSLQCTADGATHDIFSTQSIPAAQGDKVNLSAWVKTSGYAGSGTPISVSLIPFKGTVQQTAVTVASTGAQASWAQISGQYTVPADVTSIRVRLAVTSAATAGTINFDDIHLTKTGLLQQGWVERLTDAWNNFWHGIFGGVLPDNKDVDDVYTAAASVSNVANTADSNALSALAQLGELLWNLLNAPAAAIGSLINVVMDGVATVGNFLADLWGAFTGQSATNKTVAEVKSAASGVTSTANTASTTASSAASTASSAWATANLGKAIVRTLSESGANLILNSEIELAGLRHDQFRSTDYARTGSYSAKVTASSSGSQYYQGLVADDVDMLKINCQPGDYFYLEYYVRGHANNVGGDSTSYGINVYLQPYDSAGNNISQWPGVACANSTALKSGWVKQSGVVQITDSNAVSFGVFCVVKNTVSDGDRIYFDSVKLYRITEAQAALLDAAAASSAASAAQTSADTADGKAVLAQSDADLAHDVLVGRSAGPNIVFSPNFEDSSVERIYSGTTDLSYDTDVPYSGTQCLLLKYGPAGGWQGIYLSPSPADAPYGSARYRIPVNPGEVYQARIWVRPNGSNDYSAGTVALYLRWRESMDGGDYTDVQTNIAATGNMIPAQWQELVTTGTCPANRCALEVICVATSQTPVGNWFRFDNASVREIRNANEAQTSADAAGSAASAAQTSADTADGKAVLAQSAADTADAKAVAAQSILASVIESGQNLCTNPSFENTRFALSHGEYSTTVAHTGSRSMKLTGAGDWRTQGLISDENNASYYVPAQPDDVWWVEMKIYGDPANTNLAGYVGMTLRCKDKDGNLMYTAYRNTLATNIGTGSWYTLSAYCIAPANTVAVQPYLQLWNSVPAGQVYYFDDVKVVRVTEAYWAQQTGNAASSAASAAQTSADTADGKAVLAQGAADTADAKAVVAQSISDTMIKSGANICPNASFENTSFQAGMLNAEFSTEQARSGSRSAKLTRVGTTQPYMYVIQSPTTAATQFVPVTEGDVFYLEFWVYGHADNTSTAGTVNQVMAWCDTTTASFSYNYNGITSDASLKNKWTKVSGYVAAPAGAAFFRCYVNVNHLADDGDIFYFDDVVIQRVTEGYIADGKAGAAQTTADTAEGKAELTAAEIELRARDFTNMVPGSDFDTTNHGWSLGTGFELRTDRQHSGTTSLFMQAGASQHHANYVGTGSTTKKFEVKAGDQFLMECWAMRTTNYVNTDGDPRLRLVRSNGDHPGWTAFDINFQASNFPNSYQWYKFSLIGSIPDDGTSEVYFTLTGPKVGTVGGIWIDDIVIRRVVPADQVGELPQSKVTDLPGDLNTAQTTANSATSAASAAQTTADGADGKAVIAQDISSNLASRQNMVFSPNFEDSSVERGLIGTPHTVEYRTDAVYSGTQCLYFKYGTIGSGWQGIYLTGLPPGYPGYTLTYSCKPGETYEAKLFVRPDNQNDQNTDGYTRLAIRFRTSDVGGGDYWYVNDFHDDDVTAKATWHEYKVVGTCPDHVSAVDGKRFSYFDVLFITSNVATGNIYRLDNASVREITNAQAAQETIDTSNTNMYNAWFGSGGSGSTQNVSDTITSIKESVGSWTVEVLTTSQTWTRPTATSNILEFWAICVGGGSGGGRGFSGITGAPGGEGGSGGRWLAKAIDPSTLTSTVSVTVGAGGAGRNSSSASNNVDSPENMTNSSFGSYATTGTGITASIASFVGYYSCEDSRPGRGGDGGPESGGAQPGDAGQSTPLASGGTAGSATNNGGAGGNATLTGQTRAGGGGGGGGGGGVGLDVGNGGNGGWPGGGGGGGGGSWTANTAVAGNGGNGGNGAVILCYRLVE